MLYRVEWSINIEAETAKDAARQALEIQRDHLSTATVFEVIPTDSDGRAIRVDLVEGDSPACPNCGQWQRKSGRKAYLDCYNDCAERGFAPRQ